MSAIPQYLYPLEERDEPEVPRKVLDQWIAEKLRQVAFAPEEMLGDDDEFSNRLMLAFRHAAADAMAIDSLANRIALADTVLALIRQHFDEEARYECTR